ncbi:MAG: hypothetical protein M1592_05590 [Candidatus Thermoplasmatota archaeon]|nr:hypothetical protein [Candidatus Thermoplasmatota archaeon]
MHNTILLRSLYQLQSSGTLVLPSEKVSKLIEGAGKENDCFTRVRLQALSSKENVCFTGEPAISFEISGNRIAVIAKAKTEFMHESIRRLLDISYSVLRDLAICTLDDASFDVSKHYVEIREIAITAIREE